MSGPKTISDEEHHPINQARRTIFIWAVTILFLNQILSVITGTQSASLGTLVSELCAVGIFQYMAWYVILHLVWSTSRVTAARWQDFVVIAAFCFVLFAPTGRATWVAAIGIAIYWCTFNGGDSKVRAAGIVLAALSVQELWGHLLFSLVALPLLRVETAVVGTMLQVVRPGTLWQDNIITGPNGFGIVLYTGCSSFHNLSLGMLCWLTVSRYHNENWHIRDLWIGGLIVVTIILLNQMRLILMVQDIDLFNYWHDGIGADIFAIGASLTILLISFLGSRSSRRLI